MHQIEKVKEKTGKRINLVSPKDLEISFCVGSGKGGQAKQRTNSCAVIKHTESGSIGRCSESRSQEENKRAAFLRMTKTPKFKFWLARKLYEINNSEAMEETIDKEVVDKNLKYEIKDENGRWVEVTAEYFNSETSKQEI